MSKKYLISFLNLQLEISSSLYEIIYCTSERMAFILVFFSKQVDRYRCERYWSLSIKQTWCFFAHILRMMYQLHLRIKWHFLIVDFNFSCRRSYVEEKLNHGSSIHSVRFSLVRVRTLSVILVGMPLWSFCEVGSIM